MNKLIVFVVLTLLYTSSFGQTKEHKEKKPDEIMTIFGNSDVKSKGGYGGFAMRYSIIDSKDVYMNGGMGAWIIDHNLAIGGVGYSFQTETGYDEKMNENYRITGGYGGLLFEPILLPKSAIHVSFPLLVGAGGIGYRVNTENVKNEEEWEAIDADAFFVVEPGAEIEINVVKFLRIGCGVHYRFTTNVKLDYENPDWGMITTNQDLLHGFSFGLTFKFGKF